MSERRAARREQGFTVLELLVVVLVIALLLAIAIPTFLGARNRSNDRRAQSDLRNGYAAVKVLLSDNSQASNLSQATLTAAEPSLDFTGGDPDDAAEPGTVAWSASSSQVVMITKSKTGTAFYIIDNTVSLSSSQPVLSSRLVVRGDFETSETKPASPNEALNQAGLAEITTPVVPVTCGANEALDPATNTCKSTSTGPTPAPTCAANETSVNGSCVLTSSTCKNNQWYDSAQNACVGKANCTGQQVYDSATNTCSTPPCPGTQVRDTNSNQCVAPNSSNGSCQAPLRWHQGRCQ